jgi:hypothetical protein
VWRWLTSLLVQDGGVLGTASNLIFLGLLGAAAGHVAGVFWQAVGAGNSVTVCGLAGLATWSLRHERMPGWAGARPALRTVGAVAASGAVAGVLIAVENIHGPAWQSGRC